MRFLDEETAGAWAKPVVDLWKSEDTSGPPPEGARRYQHRSDLLRAYLLASYGGVWADTNVLPLAPLDAWLEPYALGRGSRSFFAFAFPDPALSTQVSLLPHGSRVVEPASGDEPSRGGGGEQQQRRMQLSSLMGCHWYI